jgi:hypothetical protein
MALQMSRWAVLAMDHWKEHQPERYKRLKDSGQLASEASQAAQLMLAEVERLEAQGSSPMEAESEAMQVLYGQPEPEKNPEPMPRSVAYESSNVLTQMLQEQNQDQPESPALAS